MKKDLSNENSISLNKYISNTGMCSRREANTLIADSRVTINDSIATLGNRVYDGDMVKLDGKTLKDNPDTIYIILNKPIGIVCTTDRKEQDNIIDFIGHSERLFPIGRLDKPSQGLILLTNDGDIVNKILRAGNKHEKEYVVKVDRAITDRFLQRMSNGIPILGTKTKKCKVTRIDKFSFNIVLTQGLNRQIRRMCEHIGYEVKSLRRTRIMNIQLADLKKGKWRNLSEDELSEILKMVKHSSKTV